MKKRISRVRKVTIATISYSSFFEVGDASAFQPKTNAIAVQKSGRPHSTDKGFPFERYSIFSEEVQVKGLPLTPFSYSSNHHQPFIDVNQVQVLGVSSSSLYQIGSLNRIEAESRIKHIRILSPQQ
ncbi:spore germination protein GerPE [Radiobacillus deserti]|uniref:Spore germination protein GerPE n=1 Tax=Radiobacillus deserti TaxID=2594883 RepID=A0A516KEL4_9BACI|nr:spore germination protein GerPE [Radiobacillus deserti]QDP39756.1 spore germination protein GerPE [Radiobacillus deserti]